MKRWMAFRLAAFLVLNRVEAWLLSLTERGDHPGPSSDDLEMQPALPEPEPGPP